MFFLVKIEKHIILPPECLGPNLMNHITMR